MYRGLGCSVQSFRSGIQWETSAGLPALLDEKANEIHELAVCFAFLAGAVRLPRCQVLPRLRRRSCGRTESSSAQPFSGLMDAWKTAALKRHEAAITAAFGLEILHRPSRSAIAVSGSNAGNPSVAAARMGAGRLRRVDVAFTKDRQLVCRHARMPAYHDPISSRGPKTECQMHRP